MQSLHRQTPPGYKPSQVAIERATSPSVAKKQRRAFLALLALTGPALLWYIVFMIGPLISMFYLSTLDWGGLLDDRHFIGLGNFSHLLSDQRLGAAIRNSVIHLFVVIPVMIPLAFLLGYFLSRRPRGYRLLSILFFTPALMSASARAMMFIGIYAPDGIINAILRAIGLPGWTHLWAAESSTALASIIALDLWSGIGFTGVVFAARLSAISPELFEAADIDGATTWTKIWQIAYPICREFFGTLAMLQFLWLLLGSAQNVLLLTQGGPGNASTTLGFMMYDEAFVASHLGYSQALGVLLFIVGLIGMLAIRRIFRPAY